MVSPNPPAGGPSANPYAPVSFDLMSLPRLKSRVLIGFLAVVAAVAFCAAFLAEGKDLAATITICAVGVLFAGAAVFVSVALHIAIKRELVLDTDGITMRGAQTWRIGWHELATVRTGEHPARPLAAAAAQACLLFEPAHRESFVAAHRGQLGRFAPAICGGSAYRIPVGADTHAPARLDAALRTFAPALYRS